MHKFSDSLVDRIFGMIRLVDWKTIVLSVWLPVGVWILIVAVVTLDGFPGILCVTPLMWLFSLTIGNRCLGNSKKDRPTLEAAIAGAIFGLLVGLVDLMVSFFIRDPVYGYLPMLTVAGGVFALVGALVCGVFSFLIVSWRIKRGKK